ncbi:hypothetical protein CRYUN_Cryun08bG0036300 [Craigia yunnanensis]
MMHGMDMVVLLSTQEVMFRLKALYLNLKGQLKNVGRDFNKFIRTDNTCGPQPPLVERLEKKVEEVEQILIREVEQVEGEVERVEKTERTLFQKLAEGFKELQEDEENFLRGLSKEEMDLLRELKMEARWRNSSDKHYQLGN